MSLIFKNAIFLGEVIALLVNNGMEGHILRLSVKSSSFMGAKPVHVVGKCSADMMQAFETAKVVAKNI